MSDIYDNTEEYNPSKKRKILILFGDVIVDMLGSKKLHLMVTKLFFIG